MKNQIPNPSALETGADRARPGDEPSLARAEPRLAYPPKSSRFVFTVLIASGACSAPVDPAAIGRAERAERIDGPNDPRRLEVPLALRLDDLPTSGESEHKPFASNWWPMQYGGIAQRWLEGTPSPAEKYDLLVYPESIRDVQLYLAQVTPEGEPTNASTNPETFHIGPTAEWELRYHGLYGAVQPEGWWGHCNGWASYSLNEGEPLRPVNVRYDRSSDRVEECSSDSEPGCIRFELGDINALGAELYWDDAAVMTGRRCNTASDKITLDPAGRVEDDSCRDGNAGSFHLAITNMIGQSGRPIILDIATTNQIWNYPAYRFEVTEKQELSLHDALLALEVPGTPETPSPDESWPYDPDARSFVRISISLSLVEDGVPPSLEPTGALLEQYTTRESYQYLLELDDAGTIIGGEWLGASKTFHPDFLWYSYSPSVNPRADDTDDRDNPGLRASIVQQILTLSRSQ